MFSQKEKQEDFQYQNTRLLKQYQMLLQKEE